MNLDFMMKLKIICCDSLMDMIGNLWYSARQKLVISHNLQVYYTVLSSSSSSELTCTNLITLPVTLSLLSVGLQLMHGYVMCCTISICPFVKYLLVYICKDFALERMCLVINFYLSFFSVSMKITLGWRILLNVQSLTT